MKYTSLKLLFILACLLSSQIGFSQIAGTNGFSAKIAGIDHITPLDGQTAAFFEDYTLAADLSYYRWLGNSFALAVPLRFGVAQFPMNTTVLGDRRSFLSLDITGQLHPFISKWKWSPYLLAGIGGFLDFDTKINPQMPLGLGLNIGLGKGSYLQLQSEYRIDFEDFRSNFMHSIGVQVNFWDIPKKEEPLLLPPPDKDGDGIADVEDKCPEVAGLAAFSGCPDTDADGITDSEDDCPTQFGLIENKGCPLADMDGDGILDAEDECPQVAGPRNTNGCPDSDGDGVIDSRDRCPTTVGTIENNGCPEIKQEVIETLNFVAQNVQFETGKATLKTLSSGILDKVYDILLQYPNYSIAIGGHTDSIGGAEINQLLSKRRAKSCYDYLVRKGVTASRMNYVGYGETRPIASNKYKDGREQNRRVEFNLFLK